MSFLGLTRIFYTTDIHGSEKVFRKFVSAGKFYNANVIICGGDITGKMIIPIIERSDGKFKANFLGQDLVLKRDDVRELEKNVRYAGYYPYITNEDEMAKLSANQEKIDELFAKLMVETLERWLRLAEEYLKGTGIKCFVTPGNDDRFDIDRVFDRFDYVVNPEGKVVYVDNHHEMISTGHANITPWKCPRDIPEGDLEKRIDAMVSQVKDMKNCIFNFHCPPYASELDNAPLLDENLKPVSAGQKLIPVGSTAVRGAIEKHQPLLGLYGHIHESRGVYKIGRTICINPGSEYGEGVLRGVIILLDENRVKDYVLTSG